LTGSVPEAVNDVSEHGTDCDQKPFRAQHNVTEANLCRRCFSSEQSFSQKREKFSKRYKMLWISTCDSSATGRAAAIRPVVLQIFPYVTEIGDVINKRLTTTFSATNTVKISFA
jgi:hypothetical protein